jgi:hypothetical protein
MTWYNDLTKISATSDALPYPVLGLGALFGEEVCRDMDLGWSGDIRRPCRSDQFGPAVPDTNTLEHRNVAGPCQRIEIC